MKSLANKCIYSIIFNDKSVNRRGITCRILDVKLPSHWHFSCIESAFYCVDFCYTIILFAPLMKTDYFFSQFIFIYLMHSTYITYLIVYLFPKITTRPIFKGICVYNVRYILRKIKIDLFKFKKNQINIIF